METAGLYPVKTKFSTHFTKSSSTLLDIFFVSNLHKCLLYDQVSSNFSKHDLIYMIYDFQIKYKPFVYKFRDYKNINYSSLENDIRLVSWDNIYTLSSIDDQINFLQDNISAIYNNHVPLKTSKSKKNNQPWFNNSIKDSISKRNEAFYRWKKYRTPQLYEVFKFLRKQTNSLIRDAKSNYFSRKFQNAINSRDTWKCIRDIGVYKKSFTNSLHLDVNTLNNKFVNVSVPQNTSSTSCINYESVVRKTFSFQAVEDTEIVRCFMSIKSKSISYDGICPVFLKSILPFILAHITHIFNNIIRYSLFPSAWKMVKIVPIPKTNSEFRPIAILPFLSKVFEVLLNRQIQRFIAENNILSDWQSGYRSKHSCLTALLDVSENIRSSIDNNDVSFLTLLDHTKAFDTVNHNTLCSKLYKMYNFSSSATNLIKSYLTDRQQAVFYNNSVSPFLFLKSGVPQGSILGPVLFSLYINDLPSIIKHCSIQMYADDVQLYYSTKITEANQSVVRINEDLSNIHSWASKHDLRLNPKKSMCLVVHKKPLNTSKFSKLFIDNSEIQYVERAKNLGLVFNNTLTWKDHICQAIGKVYGMLRTLRISQSYTPLKIRLLLSKAYLLPTLLYCSEIFANCDSEMKRKLNVVYNDISRYVYNIKRFEHISEHSKKICDMSFQNLLNKKCLIMLHKIIYKKTPKYLYNKIVFLNSRRVFQIKLIKSKLNISEKQFFIPFIPNFFPVDRKF